MIEQQIAITEKLIKDLQLRLKKLKSIKTESCIHGTYTDELFTGCKTCGGAKVVICSNEKVVGKKRNSKGCNAAGCTYFEASTNGHKKTEKRMTDFAQAEPERQYLGQND